MMVCSEFLEMLDNYELLTDSQRMELEKHICECESCKNEYAMFMSIVKATSSIPMPKAPKSLIDDVNARIDSEKPTVIGFKPNLRILSTVAACLAIGLAVGINNGYIRKNIEPKNTDGVISEVVETATEPPEVIETAEPEPEITSVETKEDVAEPIVTQAVEENTVKPTNTPATSTPTATQKATSTPTPTTEPIQTQSPTATPYVNEYEVEEGDIPEEYAHRQRFSSSNIRTQFSDYLYVDSEDMGAVISAMSELGFEVSGGYYMGTRSDFYELMNMLSERGISYECTLKYNTGDNVAFNLQYS